MAFRSGALALLLCVAWAPQESDSFTAPIISAQPSAMTPALGLKPRSGPSLIHRSIERSPGCRARMTSASQPSAVASQPSETLDESAIGFPFGKTFVFEGSGSRAETFLIEFGEYDQAAEKPRLSFRAWKVFSSQTFVSLQGHPAKEPCMVWVRQEEDGSLRINLRIEDEIAPKLRMSGVFCFKDRHTALQIIYLYLKDGALTVRQKLPKDPALPCEMVSGS